MIPSPLMTAAELAAYTWALSVDSNSTAALNARTLARYVQRLELDGDSAARSDPGYFDRTLREWLEINPNGFTVRADGQIEATTDEALIVIVPRSRYVFQDEVEAELDRIRPTLDRVEKLSAELVRRLAEARRVAGELCVEIEKLPAGEQQTKVSLMASGLRQGLG